mgnify:CR=1 FL=1
MTSRAINTTYCDDIRREVGNKMSYMGVYSSKLLVPEFPAILPKLSIIIEVRTPISEPFEELELRVLQGEQIVGQVEFDSDILSTQSSLAEEPDADNDTDVNDGLVVVRAVVTISPLVISENQTIRVRAITESGELKGPGLRLEKTEPQ